MINRNLPIEYDRSDEVAMKAFAQAILAVRFDHPSTIPEAIHFIEHSSEFRDIQLCEFFNHV